MGGQGSTTGMRMIHMLEYTHLHVVEASATDQTAGDVLEAVQSHSVVVIPAAPFRRGYHHSPLAVHVVVGRGLEDEMRCRRRGFQDYGLLGEPRSGLAWVLQVDTWMWHCSFVFLRSVTNNRWLDDLTRNTIIVINDISIESSPGWFGSCTCLVVRMRRRERERGHRVVPESIRNRLSFFSIFTLSILHHFVHFMHWQH